jgi:hypothetical protein
VGRKLPFSHRASGWNSEDDIFHIKKSVWESVDDPFRSKRDIFDAPKADVVASALSQAQVSGPMVGLGQVCVRLDSYEVQAW